MKGLRVGALEGNGVGLPVGGAVGALDGRVVGIAVGDEVGLGVGGSVRLAVGKTVGKGEGLGLSFDPLLVGDGCGSFAVGVSTGLQSGE